MAKRGTDRGTEPLTPGYSPTADEGAGRATRRGTVPNEGRDAGAGQAAVLG